MRSFKKLLASLIARATKRMGIAACGCASMYGAIKLKETKKHLQELSVKLTRITISITKTLSFPLKSCDTCK